MGIRTPSRTGLARTLAAEMRTVFRKLKLRVREHGGGNDLTPSQASVLLRLEKDGAATVSSMARAEGMRPQSMSAIVAPLQESGLIRGVPDPSDGRQTLMSLTPKLPEVASGGQGRPTRLDSHDHLPETFYSRAAEASRGTRTAFTAR